MRINKELLQAWKDLGLSFTEYKSGSVSKINNRYVVGNVDTNLSNFIKKLKKFYAKFIDIINDCDGSQWLVIKPIFDINKTFVTLLGGTDGKYIYCNINTLASYHARFHYFFMNDYERAYKENSIYIKNEGWFGLGGFRFDIKSAYPTGLVNLGLLNNSQVERWKQEYGKQGLLKAIGSFAILKQEYEYKAGKMVSHRAWHDEKFFRFWQYLVYSVDKMVLQLTKEQWHWGRRAFMYVDCVGFYNSDVGGVYGLGASDLAYDIVKYANKDINEYLREFGFKCRYEFFIIRQVLKNGIVYMYVADNTKDWKLKEYHFGIMGKKIQF